MKTQNTTNSQGNPEKKQKSGDIILYSNYNTNL